jgi:hypothetical protein
MVSLLFTIALFHYIFGSFKATGYLNCGLFGGGFNRPIDEIILGKLKMLGFFNQSRGEHSCGYFNGEEIFKGIDDKKKFTDLVMKEGIHLPEQKENNIFIGHVRQATYGSHSKENAHPFDINNSLVLAHNGTIENIWDLCTEHGVDKTGVFVDSKALGLLIDKNGYKILEEYKGFAALMVHKYNEPNTLYLYHGSSKRVKDGIEVEERPLYYLKQEEGIYVSSLEDALNYIKDAPEDKASILPHNGIYKIKNGSLFNTKLKIDRGDCNVYVYKATTVVNNTANYNQNRTAPVVQQGGFPFSNTQTEVSEAIKSLTKKFPNVAIFGEKKAEPKKSTNIVSSISGIDIIKENAPLEASGLVPEDGKLYFRFGRFWKISRTSIVEKATGILQLKKNGHIVPIEKLKDVDKAERVDTCYFYRGVMLTSQRSYDIITAALSNSTLPFETKQYTAPFLENLKQGLLSDTGNFAQAVSHYSQYPVTNSADDSPQLLNERNMWFMNGKYANSSYTPRFGSRDYHYTDGNLVKIVGNQPEDKNPLMTVVEGFKTKGIALGTDKLPSKTVKNKDYYEGIEEQEVKEWAKKFNTIYSSTEQAEQDLGDIGLCALGCYMEDLCTEVLNISSPSEQQIEYFSLELIQQAIDANQTIASRFDNSLSDLESYIMDALVIVNEENNKIEKDNDEDEEKKKLVKLTEDLGFMELNTASGITDLNDEDNEPVIVNHDASDEDEDGEEEVNKIAKTAEENEEAINILDEVTDIMNDLYKRSVDLQLLNNSNYAQQLSFELQRGLDNICSSLLLEASNMKDMTSYAKIKRVTSIM